MSAASRKARARLGLKLGGDALDEKTVLRHRERMSAARLSVPARDARKSMSDVFNLDVERRGIEQVESPSAQHALPGACAPAGGDEANDPCPFHFAQEARTASRGIDYFLDSGHEDVDEPRRGTISPDDDRRSAGRPDLSLGDEYGKAGQVYTVT